LRYEWFWSWAGDGGKVEVWGKEVRIEAVRVERTDGFERRR
jgi:hypothetical protein